MRNVYTLVLISLTIFLSCSSDDKPIDILLGAPKGALLINTDRGPENFRYDDSESIFSIEVRANDQKKGEFFDFVRVYATFQSNTTTGVNNLSEVILKDLPRSEFYLGEYNRPRIRLEFTLQEMLDAFNLQMEDVSVGDQFFIRPDMHLKDDRVIGFANRSPGIIAKDCEDSPFYYQAVIMQPISEQLFTGVYRYTRVSPVESDILPDTGITVLESGSYPNQRKSLFLNFVIAGDYIVPEIYQQKSGACRRGDDIVFWGPQSSSFGSLNLEDDSAFDVDFLVGYDGWLGLGFGIDPIPVRYRFSKQ